MRTGCGFVRPDNVDVDDNDDDDKFMFVLMTMMQHGDDDDNDHIDDDNDNDDAMWIFKGTHYNIALPSLIRRCSLAKGHAGKGIGLCELRQRRQNWWTGAALMQTSRWPGLQPKPNGWLLSFSA